MSVTKGRPLPTAGGLAVNDSPCSFRRSVVPGTSAGESLADVQAADTFSEIAAFLAEHRTLCLATVDQDGLPHAASLLYACDGLSLLWTSPPGTRHSRHLEARPAVAATIAPDYDDFRRIRGVQLEGRARRLRDPQEIDRARRIFADRYALAGPRANVPLPARPGWMRASFYRLDPLTITWIDNTRGFGVQAIVDFPSEGRARVQLG